jgi:hypothetical protein
MGALGNYPRALIKIPESASAYRAHGRGDFLEGVTASGRPDRPPSSLSDLTENASKNEIMMRFSRQDGYFIPFFSSVLTESCAELLSPTGC